MKFFNGIENLQALKKMYHALSKKYHPDMGGDNKIMAEINDEYATLFERLKKFNNESANANVEGFKYTDEAPNDFINIINALIHLQDITIEVCGLWLWISGNTYEHKDILSELGLKYSRNKKAWYYNGTPIKKHYRKPWKMEQIRMAYGSTIYQAKADNLALEG